MDILFAPQHIQPEPARSFLAAQFPDVPPGHLQQLLKQGRFLRAGTPLEPHTLVAPGDIIRLPGNRIFRQRVADGSPPLLFESETTLVVAKPRFLAVHAGVAHRDDNLLVRLERTMRRRKAPYRLRPVHRLDKETSGALLLAKGRRAARELGQLMMSGGIRKEYLALAAGRLAQRGRLTTPVRAHGKVRAAQSDFHTLAYAGGYSLLLVEPLSGRTHQIRRQLADAGAPLHGDRRYGGAAAAGEAFFLHSYRLTLAQPDSAAGLVVSAPPPHAMLAELHRLGFEGSVELPELQRYNENAVRGLCKPRLSE